MRGLLKNRLALSTVVTTLIILVVSVLLAGVVTYFAINVTSTRVQEENLHLTKQHVWYNTSGTSSQAAILVINTGGRDVVIDKITVRGQECVWTSVYYNITSSPPTGDLIYVSSLAAGVKDVTSSENATLTAGESGKDLTLDSGNSMIIYISSPDSISVNDVGLTVAITIYTSQAMYYKEANVEGTA